MTLWERFERGRRRVEMEKVDSSLALRVDGA